MGGGIAESLKDKYKGETAKATEPLHDLMIFRWFLDIGFFAIIVLVMLNVLFGIIVDAFGALREEKNFQKEDSVNLCFVCNLKREMFDR